MNDFRDRRCDKLSTGMKQKVSIARTLVHDPSVMIFDEPTVGLDVMAARTIVGFIRECRDHGKTVVFSTHVMSEVEKLCDHIGIIHDGKLLAEGTLPELARAIRHAGSGGLVRESCRTMSLRNIGIVYRKELIDSLRDRRTVISMIVVPLLVMPLLTIGMGVLSVTLVGHGHERNPQGHDPGRRGFAARDGGTRAAEGCADRSREAGLRRGNLQQTNSRGRGNSRGLRGQARRRRIHRP